MSSLARPRLNCRQRRREIRKLANRRHNTDRQTESLLHRRIKSYLRGRLRNAWDNRDARRGKRFPRKLWDSAKIQSQLRFVADCWRTSSTSRVAFCVRHGSWITFSAGLIGHVTSRIFAVGVFCFNEQWYSQRDDKVKSAFNMQTKKSRSSASLGRIRWTIPHCIDALAHNKAWVHAMGMRYRDI